MPRNWRSLLCPRHDGLCLLECFNLLSARRLSHLEVLEKKIASTLRRAAEGFKGFNFLGGVGQISLSSDFVRIGTRHLLHPVSVGSHKRVEFFVRVLNKCLIRLLRLGLRRNCLSLYLLAL